MSFLNKIYRRVTESQRELASFFRILHHRFKYPSLKIDLRSRLYENGRIVCLDSASCEIINSQLAPGVLIIAEKNAKLRIVDSSIGPNSVIVAHVHIEIGKNCSIAEMVVIRDQDHEFDGMRPVKEMGYTTGKIILGENVWIGAKATILKGVSIGDHCVIGANSLVNKSFEKGSVIGGVPARTLRA